MTSPADVARFHAEYDHHRDDRVRLFQAVRDIVDADAVLLYPGSYVDIAPSVWFDDVTYVDTDHRAARFFAQHAAVGQLIRDKRRAVGRDHDGQAVRFLPADYRRPLPVGDRTVDLLVSLYAGFVTEHCTRYVRSGGLVLANNSHGDASMTTIDATTELVGAVVSTSGRYRLRTDGLDGYLVPKRGEPPTIDELHETNRGVAFTKPAFAYLFRVS